MLLDRLLAKLPEGAGGARAWGSRSSKGASKTARDAIAAIEGLAHALGAPDWVLDLVVLAAVLALAVLLVSAGIKGWAAPRKRPPPLKAKKA
jgi:hypothetical protein